LSPQTTGVEEPAPGMAAFHLTFFVSLHSTGGLASGATPVASGPRHCGQLDNERRASAESADKVKVARARRANGKAFMAAFSFFEGMVLYKETRDGFRGLVHSRPAHEAPDSAGRAAECLGDLRCGAVRSRGAER